jgi:cell division protein FtsN
VLVLALLGGAIALVALGVAHSNAEKKRLAIIAHADSLKAAAIADSVALAQRDSIRADSLRASLLPKPKVKPTPPPTASAPSAPAGGSAPATAAAPPAVTRHYGLAVGEFLDEDKANSEKDRLATSTGLPGRVVPIDKGASFQVIIGSYDSKSAAQKAAGDLSGKGVVNEAQVTLLPKE